MHSKQEVFATIKKVLLTFLDIDPAKILPSTSIESLGLESLDFVELQVELQKAYGVRVDSAALADNSIATMEQFADYVAQAGAQQGESNAA